MALEKIVILEEIDKGDSITEQEIERRYEFVKVALNSLPEDTIHPSSVAGTAFLLGDSVIISLNEKISLNYPPGAEEPVSDDISPMKLKKFDYQGISYVLKYNF